MISATFIRRPVLATVLSVIVVVVGYVSLVGLPVTQYPEITPVQVTVSASYPGADAETVANSVAAPIESQVNGVDNMLYMQSTSSATGDMTLTVFFAMGTDPDTAEVQVNNRVNLALPQLPEAVTSRGVRVQKRSSSIMMLIAVYAPDGRYDEAYVGNYANLYVLDALKRVDGANQASIMGLPDIAMRLWLQPDRMAGLGITAGDVQRAVSAQNQLFGAGSLGQPPTDGPVELTLPVTTGGRFTEPEEFEEIILRADPSGAAVVRFKDVGRAEEGQQAYLVSSQINGAPCTYIAVYQQPGSNALAVAQGVTALMEELQDSFPAGIEYKVALDTTKFIQASIAEVMDTLIIAIILVVLVTWLFLQSTKATLIPTIAILVSVIGTFAGMAALGFSVNLLTLFGLVLAIGIVCDDAIVVVENVERNLEEKGQSPKEATMDAMREVTGPVIATTLVLIAVFVPVAFLPGTTGELYKQFAVTIAISVAISSFVALTLTPALAALLLRKRKHEPRGFFRWFNAGVDRLTGGYAKAVAGTIKGWPIGLGVVGVMLWLMVKLFGMVPGSFVPAEDQGYVLAAVIMPDGTSLERTSRTTEEVAALFGAHPAVADVAAVGGYSLLDGQLKNNSGTVFVAFKDFAERQDPSLTVRGVFAAVVPQLAAIPEAVVIPINPPPIPGLGTQGGFEFWLQNRGTASYATVEETTRGLIAASTEEATLTRLNTTINANALRLGAEVDRVKAETLGVPIQDVYSTLQTLFGSLFVSQYDKYGRVWQVILQAEPEYREKPEDIQNIFVRQVDGMMVPLSALVETEFTTGAELVSRFNGFPAAKINGDAAAGYSSGQAIAAMEQLSAETLPPGFAYAWSGQAYEEKQSSGTAGVVFLFALLMVFLILAAQYEQWALPMAVLAAVPFGIFGAILFVWYRGMENDVYFQIGLVTLIGLSAKNAILIVEFAELKFREGMKPFDAAVEAARLRLRPIMMTSFSFILGALPLILASGAGAKARHSIGTGIIGGMIAATTLALFFVPLFYWMITSIKARFFGAKA